MAEHTRLDTGQSYNHGAPAHQDYLVTPAPRSWLYVLSAWCTYCQELAKLALLLNVAEEAAADAKQRAKEAREWIDNWKGKQRAPISASKSIETRGF